MADVTKAQIKEAISTIRSASSLLKVFSSAEESLALLGNLDSQRELLQKKVGELSESVKSLEGKKLKLSEAKKKEDEKIQEYKDAEREKAESWLESEKKKAEDSIKAHRESLENEVEKAAETRTAILKQIEDLEKRRNKYNDVISGLDLEIVEKSKRLESIKAEIASIKASL